MRFLAGVALACVLCAGGFFAMLSIASAHDIYMDWKRPGSGISCCDNRDCYQTQAQFRSGAWYALRREDQKWLRVPNASILKNEFPEDGNAHLCAPPPAGGHETVYCFTVPQSGS